MYTYVCVCKRIRMCLYSSVCIQLLYNEIAKLMKIIMKNENQHQKEKEENKKREEKEMKQKRKQMHIF